MQALGEAKKLVGSGDADKALELARKAEALAKASIAQSKAEDQGEVVKPQPLFLFKKYFFVTAHFALILLCVAEFSLFQSKLTPALF